MEGLLLGVPVERLKPLEEEATQISPLPAASCCLPPRSVFVHCPSNCGFYCLSQGEEGAVGEAVTLEWALAEPEAWPSQTRALVWPF